MGLVPPQAPTSRTSGDRQGDHAPRTLTERPVADVASTPKFLTEPMRADETFMDFVDRHARADPVAGKWAEKNFYNNSDLMSEFGASKFMADQGSASSEAASGTAVPASGRGPNEFLQRPKKIMTTEDRKRSAELKASLKKRHEELGRGPGAG